MPQKVGLNHPLLDEDVFQIYKKAKSTMNTKVSKDAEATKEKNVKKEAKDMKAKKDKDKKKWF